jgi:hypothetical protein
LRIFEDGFLYVLTEETEINILGEVLNLFKGKPLRLFNLFCVLRKEAVFLRNTVDVVLSSFVLLVADVVLGESESCLFLQFSECTSKTGPIVPLSVALGKGPFLSPSSSDEEDSVCVCDANASIHFPLQGLVGIKCARPRGSHSGGRWRGECQLPGHPRPSNLVRLRLSFQTLFRMSYWVAGHLTGGLGNRLFQHAAALGLGEAMGRKVVFSLPHCSPTGHGAFDNVFKMFPNTPVLQEESPIHMIPEPNGYVFTYTEIPQYSIPLNLVVDGYRQSERYFPKVGVHADLEGCVFHEKRSQLLAKYGLETQETKENTWFLHIRLGDYKILPHHQIDIGRYVSSAANHLPPGSKVLVFSDEATANKEMLERFVTTLGHKPIVVDETDEVENLFLMSQCWAGAIVANSTFSWWGAYFARQRCPKKGTYKALYPTIWGSGLPPARDIVPSWGIPISLS